MAISLTTLNGTDSIAASRITINDNFATISAAMNSLLQIIDIATGFFDNSTFGSNNNIQTGNITITGNTGVTVTTGNINISNGNLTLAGRIEFGAGTNVILKKTSKPLTTGSIFIFDASGSTGITGPSPVGYYVIPRQTTAVIQDIQNPELGALVYDTALNVLAICVGTTTTIGGTGTWVKATVSSL